MTKEGMHSGKRCFCYLVLAFPLLLSCNHEVPVQRQERVVDELPVQVGLSADNALVQAIVAAISADSLRHFVETLVNFRTRHSVSDTVSSDSGIGGARNWLFRKLTGFSQRSGGRFEVFFDDFVPTICGETRLQRNVVGRLPGTANPERLIIVSGHYDSRTVNRCDGASFAPGANDDGSGTAAVLELARVMSAFEFDATLLFIVFAGEEQGLFGSRHYAAQARARGDQIIAMVTNDVIGNVVGGSGRVDSTSVRCFSEEPMDSPHRQLARYIKLQGEAYVAEFTVNTIPARDRPGRGGDHFAFVEQGFTAARLTEPEDNLDRQHNPNDLPAFMSFSYLRRVTQVNAAYLASLANAPAAPRSLAAERLDASRYRLDWSAAAVEGNSYLIALRHPQAVAYDSLLVAGQRTEVILQITGPTAVSLAAVDSGGNESLFSSEILLGAE